MELRAGWWHYSRMDSMSRIRKLRGLTQAQLAEAIGANQATISKIEKGEGNPTLHMIMRIAAALRVHPTELFSRGALQDRFLTALSQIPDDETKEAAVIVLESMATKRRP
jgi:transcriptional regulator with XRE-family HTH domain